MSKCHEIKSGEVYVCSSCGLELQVLKSCADTGACSCASDMTCCGKPLERKS